MQPHRAGQYQGLDVAADADEIVSEHLVGGRPVERLRYRPATMGAHKLERDPDGRPIGRAAPWPAGAER